MEEMAEIKNIKSGIRNYLQSAFQHGFVGCAGMAEFEGDELFVTMSTQTGIIRLRVDLVELKNERR
jgi:hypothetical protein